MNCFNTEIKRFEDLFVPIFKSIDLIMDKEDQIFCQYKEKLKDLTNNLMEKEMEIKINLQELNVIRERKEIEISNQIKEYNKKINHLLCLQKEKLKVFSFRNFMKRGKIQKCHLIKN